MKAKIGIKGNVVNCDTIFIELPNGKRYSVSEDYTYEEDPIITIRDITIPSSKLHILPQASNAIIIS